MEQLIEQLTKQYNLSEDEAASIINTIANYAGQVIDKVPKLSQWMDDIFEDIDEDLLQQHIINNSYFIQQHKRYQYKFPYLPLQPVATIMH